MSELPVLGERPISYLLSVPWPPGTLRDNQTGSPADAGKHVRAALLPGLAQAHATGDPVFVAWLRDAPGAPVQVLLGPQPRTHDGQHATSYPPGGRAVPCPDPAQRLGCLTAWVGCAADIHPAAVPETDPLTTVATAFEDHVDQLGAVAFAWVVIATPVPDNRMRERIRELAYLMPRLRDRRDTSEAARLELQRQETQYREFSRAEQTGMWDVRLFVGAENPAAARGIAALLCRAAQPEPLPYAFRPLPDVSTALEEAWQGTDAFLASGELLASLARPPLREVPGVRTVRPSTFDVTPELNTEGRQVELGVVLDRTLAPAGRLAVSTSTLNRHTFVCGATGSGKSQTIRALLESLHRLDVPWLVIEPAKAEYARMAGRLAPTGEVLVIRPGEIDTVPVALNPLEPEPGFPLQTHIDLVRALFLAAFQAQDPFPQILSRALTNCYQELGWDLALGEPRNRATPPRYPNLGDLQRTARTVVQNIGYGADVTGNVRGFIDVRIGSLRLGAPGRFFEGGHPLDIARLLSHNVVLELEDIGNDQDKAFFIGTVLIRIVEHLRARAAKASEPPDLRHVTVIEEAHRLLRNVPPGSPAAHAVELFAELLAEIRAYGEGVIVAEQIPAKILPDVIKNTALKVMHRLPAHDDRFTVGATINLDQDQSEYVVTLPPGRAAVFADGMDRPVLVQMPLGETRENASAARRNAPVARPVRAACIDDCAAHPCTVRQLTAGARLAENPELALWIEVLTAAHVLGRPVPKADPAWLARLHTTDSRTLHCAIAQLAHAAVDRRYPALVEHYAPEALARHVAEQVRSAPQGPSRNCDGTEVEWQAGNHRWVDVFHALSSDDHPRDQPHPNTEAWRHRGLNLTGLTAAEQLATLRRMPSSWNPDRLAIDGAGEQPEHARLAANLSHASDSIDRLRQATWFLTFPSDWPYRRLYPREWAARQHNEEHHRGQHQ